MDRPRSQYLMLFVKLAAIHTQAIKPACAFLFVKPHSVESHSRGVDPVIDFVSPDNAAFQPSTDQIFNPALAGL